LELANKYWLDENQWGCVFCDEGRDNVEHYVGEWKVTIEWFTVLGKNKEEIIKRIYSEDLEGNKGKVLRKLWKEKEKRMKTKEKEGRKE